MAAEGQIQPKAIASCFPGGPLINTIVGGPVQDDELQGARRLRPGILRI